MKKLPSRNLQLARAYFNIEGAFYDEIATVHIHRGR